MNTNFNIEKFITSEDAYLSCKKTEINNHEGIVTVRLDNFSKLSGDVIRTDMTTIENDSTTGHRREIYITTCNGDKLYEREYEYDKNDVMVNGTSSVYSFDDDGVNRPKTETYTHLDDGKGITIDRWHDDDGNLVEETTTDNRDSIVLKSGRTMEDEDNDGNEWVMREVLDENNNVVESSHSDYMGSTHTWTTYDDDGNRTSEHTISLYRQDHQDFIRTTDISFEKSEVEGGVNSYSKSDGNEYKRTHKLFGDGYTTTVTVNDVVTSVAYRETFSGKCADGSDRHYSYPESGCKVIIANNTKYLTKYTATIQENFDDHKVIARRNFVYDKAMMIDEVVEDVKNYEFTNDDITAVIMVSEVEKDGCTVTTSKTFFGADRPVITG